MSSIIHNKSITLLYKILKSRTIVICISIGNTAVNDIMQRKQNQIICGYMVFRFRCDIRTKPLRKRGKHPC